MTLRITARQWLKPNNGHRQFISPSPFSRHGKPKPDVVEDVNGKGKLLQRA